MEKNHGKGKFSTFPSLFEDWMLSKKSNQELQRITIRDILKERLPSYTKNLLQTLTSLMFDSEKFAQVMDLHSGVDLMKILPKETPIYLMSKLQRQGIQ
jgi:hypothetical protein